MLTELLLDLMKRIKTECLKGTPCSKCPFAKKRLTQRTVSGRFVFPVEYSYELTCSIGNPESWLLEVEDDSGVEE